MRGTVCYAVESGLGYQAKSFIDNGYIQKILVWPHSTYPTQDWYPAQRVKSFDELLECDEIVFFETPFDWNFIPRAREAGKKTILMAMYECTQYPFPYFPDVLVGGSAIEPVHYKELGCPLPCVHINVPVKANWKLREKAKVFIHNAGHGGLGGRNGTKELLDAMKLVKSPVKLIIRAQAGRFETKDPRITIIHGSVPYEDLWKEGDVMILPEKFGGSFLPMQEAFASGLGVMASDRFPTNSWLPNELLIKVSGYKRERIGSEFDSAVIHPVDIASCIDKWYDEDLTRFSLMGKAWGVKNSWAKLRKKYEAL